MAKLFEPPFYPIVYVRGYAGSQGEVEDTVADPYMGFNLGSTKIRQLWDGQCKRHYFESPLVRLMKDHTYRDVYDSGDIIPPPKKIDPRSIFIYRYYERTSTELGDGNRLSVEEAAKGLSDMILMVRQRVCGESASARNAFRIYLVSHSMGGLVLRCFLQNNKYGDPEARQAVDKCFTYATPHNGIDLQIIGNVPGFFTANDLDNFNRKRMRSYLELPALARDEEDDVSSLNGRFDPERFFNLVGTNDKDYTVALNMSRRIVGPMSDGLVRIVNATTWGPYKQNGSTRSVSSPRAFVHRSHSGHYGIVNSEEGYQNLTRFLFGNVRVDGVLEVHELSLPPDVEKAKKEAERRKEKEPLRASYHFETVVRVRGKLWELHRRTVDSNSAVFRKYDDMIKEGRHPFLFSLFLSRLERVDQKRESLGFSIDLRVLVPQYQVAGVLWFRNHYEGGYLFRDKINIEAIPPDDKHEQEPWTIRYGFDSRTPNGYEPIPVLGTKQGEQTVFQIPIEQPARPGIKATLVLLALPWNQ